MTPHLISDRYRDPVETSRRTEGTWYGAARDDGTRVRVLVPAPGLASLIRDADRFFEILQRAAHVGEPALGVPVSWGRTGTGVLHVAYAEHEPVAAVSGTLLPREVATLGVRLARALATAHRSGVAHGAITPPRIVSAGEGILDEFGLLPALLAGGVGVHNAVAALCETAYVSPEAQAGGVPDERSDVYSLGAVLYELLTGKAPHGGRTTAYVMASVLADVEGAEPVDSAHPVVAALLRAIESDPADRWPDATSFARALEAGLERHDRTVTGASAGKRGCLPGTAAVTTLVAVLVATSVATFAAIALLVTGG